MRTSLFTMVLLVVGFSAAIARPIIPDVPLRPLPGDALDAIKGLPAEIRATLAKDSVLRQSPPQSLPLEANDQGYDNVTPARTDFQVVDVHLKLNLDEPDYIESITDIAFVPMDSSVKSMTLLSSVKNLQDVAFVDGPEIEQFNQVGSYINIDLLEPLPMGQTYHLRVVSAGAIVGDSDSMLATSRLDGNIWYVTHSQFMPTKNSMDDVFVGTMTIEVTGQEFESARAGGTGILTQTLLDTAEGKKTFVMEHIFPTSLYAFAISDFIRLHSTDGVVDYSVYADSSQTVGAGKMLGIMQDVVAHYSDFFVAYPWEKLDAVAMPNSFSGGFGPLSTVMMMVDIFDIDDEGHGLSGSMQLASHEIGHQWWGNLVEMKDRGAIFLSEGLAEFSSNFYFETVTDNRWPFASNNLSYVYTVPADQEPALASPFVYNSPYYYQVAYQKGACVAESLRTELGEELFLEVLSTFAQRFYMNYANIEDFFDIVEEVVGEPMDWFYEQWFLGQGPARLMVGAVYQPQGQTLRFKVAQEEDNVYRMTLPIWIQLLDGTYLERQVVITKEEEIFDVPITGTPLRILIDPRFRQLRRIYPLLPGDLDLNGLVDGRDLVEMSYAYGVNIVIAHQGNEYFIPNSGYVELADLIRDNDLPGPDGKVGLKDLEELKDHFGQKLEP